jgi:hypothetical protein
VTQPSPETTEQRLRRFLESGGRTSLDVIRTFAAPAVRLSATQPAVIRFDRTEDLAAQLDAAGGDARVFLRLMFAHSPTPPDFGVLAFMNTPGAGPATSPSEPGFLGAVAFFCHAELRDGKLVCVDHGSTLARFRLRATAAVRKTSRQKAVTVTLIPVRSPQRSEDSPTLTVTASLDLVRTTVTRPK